jgi:putative transcriptional regulator
MNTTSTSTTLIKLDSEIESPCYIGYLLAANPLNPSDELDHGVILIVSHDRGRAVGIQLNNAMRETTIRDVAENIGMEYFGRPNTPLYHGGRVNHGRVNIVHSDDWSSGSSSRVGEGLFLTSDISVLAAIAAGEGPSEFRACAGYQVWENYALERELDSHLYPNERRKWEIVEAAVPTVFDYDGIGQWKQTMQSCAALASSQWLENF